MVHHSATIAALNLRQARQSLIWVEKLAQFDTLTGNLFPVRSFDEGYLIGMKDSPKLNADLWVDQYGDSLFHFALARVKKKGNCRRSGPGNIPGGRESSGSIQGAVI
jgi:hypothetical protein